MEKSWKEVEKEKRAWQQSEIKRRERIARDNGDKVYGYVIADQVRTTHDKAFAARYNAQNRFYGMNKFQQAIAKLTGQYRKFSKLWDKSVSPDLSKEEKEQAANDLNKMFRR